ncbi:PAS domain-containing sensor histidine kinase [Henriciella sp. AS95]|uniref:PAS domain-containing sensor histidine kinase n=1 Tax=Henriciella sp. AS95 TaxID=3135782 RepID=UPI00317E5D1C
MDEHHLATENWRLSPDMLCILDQNGCFAAVNPAWEATLGWTPKEMVGRPYLDFLHPDDVARSMEGFEELRKGHPVLRFENRYRTNDGKYRWLSWVAVPEEGIFYCTTRDVTDHKERDQTILDQRLEAELREQFLAILGHDLRNPLGSIVSGLNLLSRESHSEKSEKVLQGMRASSARMSELISNMMDFARVRLGDGIGLEKRPHTDLADQISQVISEIRNAHPAAVFKVDVDIEGAVTCDAARIMQVMSNLIGNAVTHGPPGEPIHIQAGRTGDKLKISVSNSGKAIPADSRENLFRPFFKGKPQASPQGLGLGLYISAQIVEAHGGEINVLSDDTATRFEITLPC